jgi:hypothetical protein
MIDVRRTDKQLVQRGCSACRRHASDAACGCLRRRGRPRTFAAEEQAVRIKLRVQAIVVAALALGGAVKLERIIRCGRPPWRVSSARSAAEQQQGHALSQALMYQYLRQRNE